MTLRFLWPVTSICSLLGAAAIGSGCQQPAPVYEVSRVLSFRRTAVMDTVTAVLNGQVTSSCRQAGLPATVRVLSNSRSFCAKADAHGRFQFMHIPASAYQLAATCPGYGTLAGDTIRLGAGDGSEVLLELGCQLAPTR